MQSFAVGSRACSMRLTIVCLLGLAAADFSPLAPRWAAAQEEDAAARTSVSLEEFEDPDLTRRKAETFLVRMMRASGLFGFLILLIGLAMLANIVSLLLQLHRDNYLPAALIEQLEQKLDTKDYQGAFDLAQASESFIGRVLAAGLGRLRDGYAAAEAGMQEVGDDESLAMEQKIGYLSLVGTVAPMLGLLGTVQGMLLSFDVLANLGTTPKPYQLADGITTALVTTLEGLIVALPAMACGMFFKNRLARFLLEAGHVADQLMGRFHNRVPPTAPPAPTIRSAGPTSISAPSV